jgi:FAD/FMN-containing dehydrogenase
MPPPPPAPRRRPTKCADLLARRLRAETRGEVLFDAASRGRYATDASIYQIMPVGVFVPRDADDVATALAIAATGVPVLPRGGGTSQCGQTVGAALVIDTSKHLRRVLDVDTDARQVTVEPGLVLDHLNASSSRTACGTRWTCPPARRPRWAAWPATTAAAAAASPTATWCTTWPAPGPGWPTAACTDFGPRRRLHRPCPGDRPASCAAWPRSRAEIEPAGPRCCAAWPATTWTSSTRRASALHPDGSVNLAHLLVGSEGTLAFTEEPDAAAGDRCRAHKVLGVVNFPSFYQAMAAAQHIVKLGPTAVELVDRTMVELALANPAFPATMQTALIGRPDAILLVEFAGPDKAALLPQLQRLQALMGDLGLPGQRGAMPDETAEGPVGSAQGRPEHHDEPEGRRQAGELHRRLRRAAGAPGRLHRRADRGVCPPRHPRHLVRPCVGGHAACAAHPRHAPRRPAAVPKMRAIAEEAAELVRKYKGAFSGEHGDGLCRGEWIQWQFGPDDRRLRAIKQQFDPQGLFNPARSSTRRAWTTARCCAFRRHAPRPYQRIPLSRRSTGRPGTCRTTR